MQYIVYSDQIQIISSYATWTKIAAFDDIHDAYDFARLVLIGTDFGVRVQVAEPGRDIMPLPPYNPEANR